MRVDDESKIQRTDKASLPVAPIHVRQNRLPANWRFLVPVIITAVAVVVPGMYEYLTLRGWVNVEAARILLSLCWIVAVLGLIWGTWFWPNATPKRRILTVAAVAMALGFAFVTLDRYVTSHPTSESPQRVPKAAEIAAELFKIVPGLAKPIPIETFKEDALELVVAIEDADHNEEFIEVQRRAIPMLGSQKAAGYVLEVQDHIRELWKSRFSVPVNVLRRELAKRDIRDPELDMKIRILDTSSTDTWRRFGELTILQDVSKKLREMLKKIPPVP